MENTSEENINSLIKRTEDNIKRLKGKLERNNSRKLKSMIEIQEENLEELKSLIKK